MSAKRKAKPRDPSGGNLGILVALRARDREQMDRWTTAAARAGVSRTEWLRDVADRAARRSG